MHRQAAALVLLSLPGIASAEGLPATLGDWGGIGLLLDPTARVLPLGTVAGGITLIGDLHRHLTVTAVPLPWLEVTLRQTLYPNTYGLSEPGVDVKIRLLDESRHWPALAVGGRDITGSGYPLPGVGRFAGEYLVATRRWWDTELTLGLGWGRLGGYGHFRNPLSLLGGRYAADRDPFDARGRGPRGWFTGRDVALFGGVEWHTPLPGVSLKLEYSGDNFRAEQQDDPAFVPGVPINAGLVWRPLSGVEISAGIEQGRRAMLRVSGRFGPDDLPSPPPGHRPSVRQRSDGWMGLDDAAILEEARLTGLPARAVRSDGDSAAIWLDPAGRGVPLATEIGRAARLLADRTAPEVERLTVRTGAHGLHGSTVTLQRDGVRRAANGRGSPEELWQSAPAPLATPRPVGWEPWLAVSVDATVDQSLSEHGAIAVQRSYLDFAAAAEPLRGFVMAAGTRTNLSDSLASLDTWALPAAEPVRSDLPLYAVVPVAVEHAYVAWLGSPADGVHLRLAAGHFEEMFGGFGGEVLVQPAEARWAIGLDLHRVWKRPPEEGWRVDPGSARDTGHLSLYLEAPDAADWSAAVRAGRYLGGDWGGGIEIARTFGERLRLGAYVNWTTGPEGSQSRYGGRLDHGLTITIPFGVPGGLPVSASAASAVRTLGRDAGQRLVQPLPLHDTVVSAGAGRLAGSWPALMD